jgi:5-methylcytosine-specific restriction endonuclease McrA
MSSNQERKARRRVRKKQSRINFSLKKRLSQDITFTPCCYCKLAFLVDELTVEHKIPICLGGTNDLDNMALACAPCNQQKGREAWSIKKEIGRQKYER